MSILPTPHQELLLRAALWNREEARHCWKEWKNQANSGRLDLSSERLFPLVYRNLSGERENDPYDEKLKRLYQVTWYRNRLLFAKAVSVLRLLQQSRIPMMLLKGAPLILLYYKDYGVRPMDDIDVLVPAENAREATSLLLKSGLLPKDYPWHAGLDHEPFFQTRHSHNFRHSEQFEIDLHWRVFPYGHREEEADGNFWTSAQVIEFQKMNLVTMCSSDLLMHVCALNANWQTAIPLRWAADATRIIQGCGGTFDWERLLAQARRHQASLVLHRTLSYLKDGLRVCIPDEVLQGLKDNTVTRSECVLYWANTRFPGPIERLIFIWVGYFHSVSHPQGASTVLRSLHSFMKYLQFRWSAKHLWLVPLHAFIKTFKHIGVVLSRGLSRMIGSTPDTVRRTRKPDDLILQ